MVIERPNIYVLKMGKEGKASLSGEEYKDALASLTPENVSGKDSNIIIGDDMAKQLASGKEVDINGNAKMLTLDKVKGDIDKLNTFEFKKMFMADKMYTVIKDLDSWLKNSFNALNAYTSL